MNGLRIDKWLWAARFFKTRSLATHACELGRIQCNGHPAKPAKEVKVGDLVEVKNEGGDFQVDVLGLSDLRGPAAVAQLLYRETETSRQRRAQLAEDRKNLGFFDAPSPGRPSKRDRREMDRFRGRG